MEQSNNGKVEVINKSAFCSRLSSENNQITYIYITTRVKSCPITKPGLRKNYPFLNLLHEKKKSKAEH